MTTCGRAGLARPPSRLMQPRTARGPAGGCTPRAMPQAQAASNKYEKSNHAPGEGTGKARHVVNDGVRHEWQEAGDIAGLLAYAIAPVPAA